jgi:hypothetical protein
MKIDQGKTETRHGSATRFGVLMVLLASTLATHRASAQQPAVAKTPGFSLPGLSPRTEKSGVEATDDTPKKPGSEGIKVHGHWTIDIRNPDGTLVRHVEFDNALSTPGEGDLLLTALLTGSAVAADWGIEVSNPTNTLCGPSTSICFLVGSTTGALGSGACTPGNGLVCSSGLSTLFLPAGAGSSAGLHLQGSFTAANTTSITLVGTVLGICLAGSPTSSLIVAPIAVSPGQCLAATKSAPPPSPYVMTGLGFTSTNPGTIGVTAGQVVTAGVTIRFS